MRNLIPLESSFVFRRAYPEPIEACLERSRRGFSMNGLLDGVGAPGCPLLGGPAWLPLHPSTLIPVKDERRRGA